MMATSKPPSKEDLQERGAQIEKQWQEVRQLQLETLEAELREKVSSLKDERGRFNKLKEDFKYNLKLLMERDQELERYDASLGKLKAALQAKDGEVGDLKIQIDDLKQALGRDQEQQEEMRKHYQQRVREKQKEIEQYKKSKDEEVELERSEVEAFRVTLERQVRQLEDELDVQRRELSAGFEEAMKRREKEYRSKIEELSSAALSYEMKAKFLAKEVDLVRTSAGKTGEDLAASDETVQELEKQIKEKEWELCNAIGTKDARISELETELQEREVKLQRHLEEFKRKHNELDRYAREKESALTSAKDCHLERERHLEGTLRDLRALVEANELENRKSEWQHEDCMKEKDGLIGKLKDELNAARIEADARCSRLSEEMSKMARETETAQERDDKLKAELDRRKEDIERYKRDMTQAVAHQAEMERTKAQLELDWQRRYEEAERNQYSRSEELIQGLTKSRDEALALVKERDREMIQKDQLLRSIKAHRDQAMATLKQHNLSMQHEMDGTPVGDTSAVQSLKEQNDALKAVIQKMREDMESAATRSHHPTADTSHDVSAQQPVKVYTDEYAKSLEDEIKSLKADKRELCEQLENARNSTNTGTEVSHNPPGVQQRAADRQRGDLTDQTRTHTHEIASLKQQIANLERRLGCGTSDVNGNVGQVLQPTAAKDRLIPQGRSTEVATPPNPVLQAKLKTAIHHIGRLVKERQQLIELSNRLRSEVARSKVTAQRIDGRLSGNDSKWQGTPKTVSPRAVVAEVNQQLNAVERLQYSLTTKELQMMQKGLSHDQGKSEVVQVQLSSSSSEPPSPHDVPISTRREPFQPRQEPDLMQDTVPTLEYQEASPLTQSSSGESANCGRTPLVMSSVGEESMKDIWRLLDIPPSPSPRPTFEVPEADLPSSDQVSCHESDVRLGPIEVSGSRTGTAAKPKQQQRPLSSKAQGRVRQVPTKQRRPQIRNYNMRDGVT